MRVAILGTLLGACAAPDASTCRSADWHDLGFRDAIFGMQRQEDVYAHQCGRHGVKMDVARYVQGWREGKYEADSRHAGSHD